MKSETRREMCKGTEKDKIGPLTVKRIKEEIKDNLGIAMEGNRFNGEAVSSGSGILSQRLAGVEEIIDGMLWRYGMRYARAIKKVPLLKRVAEYVYCGLAIKRSTPEAPPALPAKAAKRVSDAEPEQLP